MRSRLATALVLAGLGMTALVACGEAHIDEGKAETAIKRDLTRQTGDRGAVRACPDEVKVKRGDRFRCEAARIRRSGAGGGHAARRRGHVSWRLVALDCFRRLAQPTKETAPGADPPGAACGRGCGEPSAVRRPRALFIFRNYW